MNKQRGDILIMTLFVLAALVVMLAAWAQFAARQARSVTDQEQEEVAFQLAEAGLNHALQLLVSDEAEFETLTGQTQTVADGETGQEIGRYVLSYETSGGGVMVTTIGYAVNKPDRCQQINAVINEVNGRYPGEQFYVSQFDHVVDAMCEDALPALTSPTPLPTPSPAPTPTPPAIELPPQCSTLTIVNSIVGTSGNDVLVGTSQNDYIQGNGGSDNISGGGGRDCLVGGEGNDILNGGEGDDIMLGSAGSDQLYGDNGADNIFGGDGYDVIGGGNGDDRVLGEGGHDILRGENGSDYLDGGNGIDWADGGSGTDTCLAEIKWAKSCEL